LEASESALNNDNTTTTKGNTFSPSDSETVGDFPVAEEETPNPPSATTATSNSGTETRETTGSTETQTTEMLSDEEPGQQQEQQQEQQFPPNVTEAPPTVTMELEEQPTDGNSTG
jgi:hypothetical protein